MDAEQITARLREIVEPLVREAAKSRFNFRKGDVVIIPTCQGDVAVEMTTHKGRRVVEVVKSAGAKVGKSLASQDGKS